MQDPCKALGGPVQAVDAQACLFSRQMPAHSGLLGGDDWIPGHTGRDAHLKVGRGSSRRPTPNTATAKKCITSTLGRGLRPDSRLTGPALYLQQQADSHMPGPASPVAGHRLRVALSINQVV